MNKEINILYTEDDETLAFLTVDNLEQQNYKISHFTDGLNALQAFKNSAFDICILDIMMPKMDGFELAKAIRDLNSDIPIIFLSAKTLKEDRIKGLKLGADDYLVKPFSIEELQLKIEIFLKRSINNSSKKPNVFMLGNYFFDTLNYTIYNNNEKIKITERESELLKFLVQNKNEVLKRETILTAIWGENDYFMGRSLDVFISRLRKILLNEKNITIENLHGIGFRFNIKATQD